MDSHTALVVVARLASAGVLVSCLEYLREPALLEDHGLMSWEVSRTRHRWMTRGPLADLTDSVLAYPTVLWLLRLRALVAAVGLLGPTILVVSPWLLGVQALLCLTFIIRSRYGHDGADQLAMISLLSLTLARTVGTPGAERACMWFLTLQICLAYFVAGIAKASAKGWHDGSYLIGVTGTRMYGHPAVAKLLDRHRTFAKFSSNFVFLWECAFPFLLFISPTLAIVVLCSGVVFHLINAYVMGLNSFVWSFLAIYPAAFYCVQTRPW